MVPFALRARDSFSIGRPRSEFMRGHQKVCEKDALELGSAAAALKVAIEKYPALGGGAILDSPAFCIVIREAAGHEAGKAIIEGLKQAMTGVQEATEGENQAISSRLARLWNKLPMSVDSERVTNAFRAFAATVPGLESDLVREAHFLRFLRIISPTFVVTEPTSETQG
jgi:hypothetical protein